MKIEFSDGDIELAAQTILEATQNLALVLQGASVSDLQVEYQEANGHGDNTWLKCTPSIFDCAGRHSLRECRKNRPAPLGMRLRRNTSLTLLAGRAGLGSGFRAADFLNAEGLENVPDLHIIEVGDAHAALKSGADFAGVVLEALQRAELGSIDDHAIADDADLRGAVEHAVHDIATGDGTRALDTEGVANFGAAEIALLEDRFEQSFHGLLNFVRNFVNNIVDANVHAFLLSEVGGFS